MSEIISVSDLPESEKLFFKKDLFGYRLVNPVRDPRTGRILWVNVLFGGYRNLVFLVVLLTIFGLFVLGHLEMTKELRRVVDSPCDFCNVCYSSNRNPDGVSLYDFNWSKINETFQGLSYG